TLEVPAPAGGVLSDIAVKNGDTVAVGALLGQIKEGAGAGPQTAPATAAKMSVSPPGAPDEKPTRSKTIGAGPERPQPRDMPAGTSMPMPPSVRKMAAEGGVDPSKISGTGMHGQVTKGDMIAAIERAAAMPTPVSAPLQMRAPS